MINKNRWFWAFEGPEMFFLTTRKVDQQESLILGFWTTRNVDSTQIQNQHSVPPLAFGDCRFPLCCFFVEQKQQNGSPNQQNGHTLQQSGTQKQQSGSQKQQSGCLRNNKMGLSSCIPILTIHKDEKHVYSSLIEQFVKIWGIRFNYTYSQFLSQRL